MQSAELPNCIGEIVDPEGGKNEAALLSMRTSVSNPSKSTDPANSSNPRIVGGSQILWKHLPLSVIRDPHPLQNVWCLWYTSVCEGSRSASNYEDLIHLVATIRTVEEFWSAYCHCRKPSQLPNGSDYHLFKEGIKPMWEDESNRSGGKWTMRMKKGLTDRLWEEMAMRVIGEQFGMSDEICGAVVGIRPQEDALSLWNRSTNYETRNILKDRVKSSMVVPDYAYFDYKEHDRSLKSKVFRPQPKAPGENTQGENSESYQINGRQPPRSNINSSNVPSRGSHFSSESANISQSNPQSSYNNFAKGPVSSGMGGLRTSFNVASNDNSAHYLTFHKNPRSHNNSGSGKWDSMGKEKE